MYPVFEHKDKYYFLAIKMITEFNNSLEFRKPPCIILQSTPRLQSSVQYELKN